MGISVHALLVDLDDFKQINDRYGHGVGDAMLVAVTANNTPDPAPDRYIARVGGDEFMVLLLESREGEAQGGGQNTHGHAENSTDPWRDILEQLAV